jgi:hypothetical protein
MMANALSDHELRLIDAYWGRVVKLVEMSTAGISDGQVTGLSGLIK